MSRDFNSNNNTFSIINRMVRKMKWDYEAYSPDIGLGPQMVKNMNFVERIHYGMIDHENNSVIPNEAFIVSTTNGRVFDFVADSYSLMRLNLTTAIERGLISTEGSAIGNLDMLKSYKNPVKKYSEYLGNILNFYNNTHIPNFIGITSITSYSDYVKYFFKFLEKESKNIPITLTRWNTSTYSSILDTGLAFQYAEIDYDEDQEKIDKIVDHQSFQFFKNSCLNFGFSIPHYTPQMLVYDISSPASDAIKARYGIYTLGLLFGSRFIKTYTIDNNLLYNNINIYFNKYVEKNSQIKITTTVCGQTVSEYIRLQQIDLNTRPYSDEQELEIYSMIRNIEEGFPFSRQKMDNINKKSKYLIKRLDKLSAIGYINSEFKDQVWNKDFGFHDLKKKLEGRTKTKDQKSETGGSSY